MKEQNQLHLTGLTKRRLITIIVLVLGAFCALAVYRFRTPRGFTPRVVGLTPQEVQEVSAFIQPQTTYPILFMKRNRDGTIFVNAGHVGVQGSNSGEAFTMKESGNTWEVVWRGTYVE